MLCFYLIMSTQYLSPGWFNVQCFEKETDTKLLVQWEGYPNKDDFTWESKKRLKKDLGLETYNSLYEKFCASSKNQGTSTS